MVQMKERERHAQEELQKKNNSAEEKMWKMKQYEQVQSKVGAHQPPRAPKQESKAQMQQVKNNADLNYGGRMERMRDFQNDNPNVQAAHGDSLDREMTGGQKYRDNSYDKAKIGKPTELNRKPVAPRNLPRPPQGNKESIYNMAPEVPAVHVQYDPNTDKENFIHKAPVQRQNSQQPPQRQSLAQKRQESGNMMQRQAQKVIEQKKPPVPRREEAPQKVERSERNYLKDNRKEMIGAKPKKQEVQEAETKHKQYGKVPQYINKFKNEKEQAEVARQQAIEQAKIPPGTRLMPEEERLQTLADLEKTKLELNSQLEKMPIGRVGPQVERRKQEVMERMQKVDKAIEMFSKKTVYVAL